MNENLTPKEQMLWKIAKKRVAFKRQLFSYIVINGFLWALWFFTSRNNDPADLMPWPLWSTLGWGIGVAFSYYGAYMDNKADAVEKEFEKLKGK